MEIRSREWDLTRLEKLTQQDPTNAKGWLDLGLLCLDVRLPVDAIRALRKAHHLEPKDPRLANFLGDAYTDLGLLEEALVWYRKAVNLRSNFGEAWLNLGNVLMELGRWEVAEHAFEMAGRLIPEADEALLYRGLCLLRLNHPNEARTVLEEALRLEPGEYQTHIALCDCFLRLGNLPQAIKSCQDALRFRVNLRELEFLLEGMQLAGLSPKRAEGMRQQAQAQAREALDLTGLADLALGRQSLLEGFVILARAVVRKHCKPLAWEVLERRFGLEGRHQMTLQEVAAEYGKSREWTRQLEREALQTIETALLSESGFDEALPPDWRGAITKFYRSVQAHGPLVPLREIVSGFLPNGGWKPETVLLGSWQLALELFGWRPVPTWRGGHELEPGSLIQVDPTFDLDSWLLIEREAVDVLGLSAIGMEESDLTGQLRLRLGKRFDDTLFALVKRLGRHLERTSAKDPRMRPQRQDGAEPADTTPTMEGMGGARGGHPPQAPRRPDGAPPGSSSNDRWQLAFRSLGSLADKAYRLLTEAGRPLNLAELWAAFNARETVNGGRRRNNRTSLSNQMGKDPRFRPIGRSGNWTLTEWEGFCCDTLADIVFAFLAQRRTPAPLTEIREEVLARRPDANPVSVQATLVSDDRFVRTGEGQYGLAEWGIEGVPVPARFRVEEHQTAIREEFRRLFGTNRALPMASVTRHLAQAFPMAFPTAQLLVKRTPLLKSEPLAGRRLQLRFEDDPHVIGLGLPRTSTLMADIQEEVFALLLSRQGGQTPLKSLVTHVCRKLGVKAPIVYQAIARTPGLTKAREGGKIVCRLGKAPPAGQTSS